MGKQKINQLLATLKELHNKDIENAAKIYSVACLATETTPETPASTPKLPAKKASSGKQRLQEQLDILKELHDAELVNAAMIYAIAQDAVTKM